MPCVGCSQPGPQLQSNSRLTSPAAPRLLPGFIDIDEFIIPHNETSLPDILKDYEDASALVLYLQGFGPSGHINRPAAGVLASYTRCQPKSEKNGHKKLIVRTDKCLRTLHVHSCQWKEGSPGGEQ